MGWFGFGKTSTSPSVDTKAFVAEYKRIRPTRLRVNNALVGRLSRQTVRRGAKRLGLLRGETLVLGDEDEIAVLMDYCIFDVYDHGRNAVDQYLCDCPPDADSDEMTYLRAMQHATYTMIVVQSAERGVGCRVRNMFTDETPLLVDMGMSKTGKPGLVMATRLLDFGAYVSTGGAVLPIGVLDDDALDQWRRRFATSVDLVDFDPATLIRECLEQDAASRISYEGPEPADPWEGDESAPQVETPARRRISSAKRKPTKPAANRRCRCGSGKMFKNCCGKAGRDTRKC